MVGCETSNNRFGLAWRTLWDVWRSRLYKTQNCQTPDDVPPESIKAQRRLVVEEQRTQCKEQEQNPGGYADI